MTKYFLVAAAVCVFNVGASGAQTEDPHKKALRSIVLVTAEAKRTEDSDCFACPDSATSTGFFITDDGMVTTSYHTVRKLLDAQAKPESIKFFVQLDQYSQRREAFVEYFDHAHDILIVKTPARKEGPFDYLRYRKGAKAVIKPAITRIYTVGYPEGYNFQQGSGHVKAFEGPISRDLYLWTTDMKFKDRQSGSPVYLDDGSVIGLVKGSEERFDQNNFFVPIQYAVNLAQSHFEAFGELRLTPVNSAGIGRLQVIARVPETKREERVTTRTVDEKTEVCQQEKVVARTVKASGGWTLVPSKITASAQVSLGSTFTGIEEESPTSFVVTGVLRSQSQPCTKEGGISVTPYFPGTMKVDVAFTEFREMTSLRETVVHQRQAIEGSAFEAQLPAGATPSMVVYQKNDGTVIRQSGIGSQDGLSVRLGAANTLSIELK